MVSRESDIAVSKRLTLVDRADAKMNQTNDLNIRLNDSDVKRIADKVLENVRVPDNDGEVPRRGDPLVRKGR